MSAEVEHWSISPVGEWADWLTSDKDMMTLQCATQAQQVLGKQKLNGIAE